MVDVRERNVVRISADYCGKVSEILNFAQPSTVKFPATSTTIESYAYIQTNDDNGVKSRAMDR